MSEIFTCECGLKVPMKPEEFPLHCRCGRISYGIMDNIEIPKLEDRVDLLDKEYSESPSGLEDITACITTYRRVGCLERLVESIKQYYPSLKIDIIDTQGNLSWGRNQLVKRCLTKYCLILEDDFEFTKDTKIEILYDILEYDDDLGLVGGVIVNNIYECVSGFDMKLFRNNVEYILQDYPLWIFYNNIRYKYCDLISNFFLARKECLLSNLWDEDLALMEHIPWFWTLKQQAQYKVGYTDAVKVQHYRDRSDPIYNEHRLNVKKYKEIANTKYGLGNCQNINHRIEDSNIHKSTNNKLEVCSLWIGEKLPRLQNMCIKSWLAKGYRYKLFTYDNVDNIPDGVDIVDGHDFIQNIYLYQNASNVGEASLHANYFRYKWLYEYGGIWIDIDTACINMLPNNIVIFSSEPSKVDPYWHPNVAVTRVPSKHKVIERCLYHTERQLSEGCLNKGFFGPRLIKYCLEQYSMFNSNYVFLPDVFCPYPCWLTEEIYQEYSLPVPIRSSCIHLWNKMCSKKQIDIDAIFNPHSLYEKLWKYLGIE